METKKMLFIYNPEAGKGRIKASLFEIIDIFTKGGYLTSAYPTQDRGDCTNMIHEFASSYDVAVVSGGDGTLSEAVTGMLSLPRDERVPLGYIPSGTVNDFASGNSIPKSMTEAAHAIVDGKMINYDIGDLNGNKFVYVAGFGAFTDVSYDTPQFTKNIFGNAAYLFEGLKRLPSIESTKVDIKTDGGLEFHEDVYICLILNSIRVAGLEFGNFYDIDTSDGLFEIALIPKTDNLLELAAIVGGILNGEPKSDGVKLIGTSSAEITTEKPVRWTLDGDFGGETDHVTFKVDHNAINFIMQNGGK